MRQRSKTTVNFPQGHSQCKWSLPKRCATNIVARSGGYGLFPFERRILAGRPRIWRTPRLILLLFGGIPNSPSVLEMSFKQMLAGQPES